MSTVLETSTASVHEDGADIVQVNQYVVGSKLGEGAYGFVFECMDDKSGKFALKYVSKSLLKRQKEYTKVGRTMTITTAFDDVKKEIALMKKLHHPKIVTLHEVVDDPENDKLFMVMELVNGGQVMDWVKQSHSFKSNPRLMKPDGSGGNEMSEENARLVIRDILIGLDYLHSSHVVHRDLKPQNLLLTDSDKICVKIADFGVSHMFETLEKEAVGSTELLTKMKGTYPFYAPECLEGSSFDGYKADIWALGINLYCFLTGALPFYDESPPDLFDKIQQNPIDFQALTSFGCSEEAIDFARLLLDKNCENRFANARAVIDSKHPWLGTDWIEPEFMVPVVGEVTEDEISAALTQANLSISTVASLKVFAHKWRKRAASAAAKRKEDEIRASRAASENAVSTGTSEPSVHVATSASPITTTTTVDPDTIAPVSVANSVEPPPGPKQEPEKPLVARFGRKEEVQISAHAGIGDDFNRRRPTLPSRRKSKFACLLS